MRLVFELKRRGLHLLGLAINTEVSRRRSPLLGCTRPRFHRTALAAASQSPLRHGATLRAAQWLGMRAQARL